MNGRRDLVPQLEDLLARSEADRASELARIAAVDPALAADLGRLLAAEAALSAFMEQPLGSWAQELITEVPGPAGADGPADVGAETRVGPYRLVSVLGRGGMGTVHLAERADGGFTQVVALKILSQADSDGTLALRFAQERQILAQLSHPGIARLLDGGVTGRDSPWFALEFVDGAPLTAYATVMGWTSRRGSGCSCRSARRWPTPIATWWCTAT